MVREVLLILIGLGLVILCMNVYATVRIWRDHYLERTQRIVQSIIVWLLPIIGALVALWSMREEKFELQKYEEPGNEDGLGL